jgi:hypothetical protein
MPYPKKKHLIRHLMNLQAEVVIVAPEPERATTHWTSSRWPTII